MPLFWRRTQSNTRRTIPHLPAGLRIYAVGDIHGRLDLLDRVLGLIDADLRGQPVADYRLVFLGDYVDRGPESAGVIDRLIGLRAHYPTVCLKGNHEALMLEAIAQPANLEAWTAVGGMNTLMSYGLNPQVASGIDGANATVASLLDVMPGRHLQFLRTLALSHEEGGYFFVHAGVRPKLPLDAQREEDLIWIRDEFLLYERPFEKYIVHGHTPMREPDIRPNRMNLDTGAFATSKLTCVALEADRYRFLGQS